VDLINGEEDVFRRAASALYLADRHPFWDGQKRTAFYLADMILRVEGHYIHEDQDKIIFILTKIAR
jgi:death-on-curing protein